MKHYCEIWSMRSQAKRTQTSTYNTPEDAICAALRLMRPEERYFLRRAPGARQMSLSIPASVLARVR
jgi:hypothetical protein